MQLFLPIEYANLELDDRGFILAVEAGPAENDTIKRLNLSGEDILKRTGFIPPIGEYDPDNPKRKSMFKDITALGYGGYSVLDRKYGRIFTYDSFGNLLYTFGGRDHVKGTFVTPVALDVLADKMLVLDRRTGFVTVFKRTTYADSIHQAISFYQKGLYDKSANEWEQVLDRNANFELAYSGIGRNLLRKGKYEEAMKMFKLGNNREDYSKAYSNYRRFVINKNFTYVIILILMVLIIFLCITQYKKKVNQDKINSITATLGLDFIKRRDYFIGRIWSGLKYSFYVIFHPFDGFWELKHEKRGNASVATILLGILIMVFIFIRQYTGFIFNTRNLAKLNIYIEILSVALPFILWCIVNWSMTTLMDGKGTFKDIYIATAYSFVPIIIINIPATILSHFLTMQEGTFYNFLLVFSIIWSLILLFFGTMTIHDFNVGKMVYTAILTVIGIGFVLFIGMLFFSLINKVLIFINQIYLEVYMRL